MRLITINLLRWAVLVALYLAFSGQISKSEMAAGVLIGLLATLFAVLMRRMADRTVDVEAPSLCFVAQTAWSLMTETFRVGLVLATTPFFGHGGEFPGRQTVLAALRFVAWDGVASLGPLPPAPPMPASAATHAFLPWIAKESTTGAEAVWLFLNDVNRVNCRLEP